jgi:hypothetical protein
VTSASVPAPISAPELRTLGDIWRAMLVWIRRNVATTVLFALIGAASAWLVNVYVIATKYNGVNKVPAGSIATGVHNRPSGMLFWLLASSVVLGVAGYWRGVGTTRFFAEVRGFPATIAATMRSAGGSAVAALMWGFAVALLASEVVSPAVAGTLGIGVALTIPSVLGRVASGLLMRVWSTVTAKLAPTRRRPQPPLAAMTVGLLGSSAALVLSFVVSDGIAKLVLVGVAIIVALIVPRFGGRGAALGFLVLLACAATLAGPVYGARADDGGTTECEGGFVDWLQENCPSGLNGAGRVLTFAGLGGLAGALGGLFGGALGGALAAVPGTTMAPPGTRRPVPGGAPPPFRPTSLPNGDRITYSDDPRFGDRGRPGLVSWKGKWIDAASPEFRKGYEAEVGHQERQLEGAEFAERMRPIRDAAEAQNRKRILDEQAAAKAQKQAQQEAQETLNKVRKAALDRVGQERYQEVLDRLDQNAFKPDGSIDVKYVNDIRDVTGRLLRRDQQLPDDSLTSPTWTEDAIDIVVKPALLGGARAAAAMSTLGLSEIGWAAGGGLKQLDTQAPNFGIDEAARFVDDTLLPTKTFNKWVAGEPVSGWDVLEDVAKAVQIKGWVTPVYQGAKAGVKVGESVVTKSVVTDAGLAKVELRGRNLDVIPDGIPKKMDIHVSSVKASDGLFPPGAAGKVPGKLPPAPSDLTSPAGKAWKKLEKQFNDYGEPPLGKNRKLDPDNFILERGPDGVWKHVTADLDTFKYVGKNGVALTATEATIFTAKLKAAGLPVTHNDVVSWVTKNATQAEQKLDLLAAGPDSAITKQTLDEMLAATSRGSSEPDAGPP